MQLDTSFLKKMAFGILFSFAVFTLILIFIPEENISEKYTNFNLTTNVKRNILILNFNEEEIFKIENIDCNDTCLIERAYKEKNMSYCYSVSEENRDNCLEIFALENFEACKNLSNLEKREKCLIEFAYKNKNESICNFLLDARKNNECKENINPSCGNLSGIEKEVCLSLKYRDYKYCKSSECILIYVKELKQLKEEKINESICNLFSKIWERKVCESLIKNYSFCEEAKETKEYCYFTLAKLSNNFYYCEFVNIEDYRAECFTLAALKEKKKSYCKSISASDRRNDCYLNYSISTKDPSGCNNIIEYKGLRNLCYLKTALASEDPSICNSIETIAERTNCYGAVILQNSSLNIEKCSKVTFENWRDKCYYRYALTSENIEICNFIKDKNEKEECILTLNKTEN